MAGSLYRCADCSRYMTVVGECILALLLLARRCNVSSKMATFTLKGGDASQACRSEEHWTLNAGVSLEEVTNREINKQTYRREYWVDE